MGESVAYSRSDPDRGGGFGASQSPWAGMSIGEVLRIIGTMSDGDVRGDANALRQAIADSQSASAMLESSFGSSDFLAGKGATASSTSAATLAGRIRDALADANLAYTAMTAGADVLATAKANAPQLEALQQDVRDNPENSATARAAVDSLMRGSYSNPMNAAQSSVAMGQVDGNRQAGQLLTAGDPTAPATTTSSGGGGSGDVGSQSAAVLGTSGAAPSTTQGVTPTAAASSPALAAPESAVSAADQPLSLGNSSPSSRSEDDADTLAGSGFGDTASSGAAGSSTTGAGLGGAVPAGGLAGLAGGATGAGGAAAASSLLRRLPTPGIVGVPSAVPAVPLTPASGRPATPGSPMAPHGGQGRSSSKDTHKAAQYLHTRDNGEELVGEMPLVGPPVIGDWATPAPPSTPPRSSTGAGTPKNDAP